MDAGVLYPREFQEVMVMNKVVSKTGSEYELLFVEQGYKWKGINVPVRMQGIFTGPDDALRAFKIYDANLEEKKVYQSTDLEHLDILTKKSELIEFAEKLGIEVDSELKIATSIKKNIKEQLEARA